MLESFGIAALEARCAGLPVLARAGTGVEEFIDQGVDGWLVHSDRALADMITDLAVDRHRLEQVARHNRNVPTGINWTMVLDRYDDVYRKATARHGRPWPLEARGQPEPVRVGGL